jgi:cyanate lyase
VKRRIMRAVVVSAVLVLAAAASPALAQGVQESLELSREVIDQQKRVIVAGSLPLSDEEADAFWPLFDEFQKELKKLDARSDRLIASYTAELPTLTDDRARSMLDEALSIDEDRAKLKRQWVKRMAKALPPRSLVRYFQLENKFEAVVTADLARQIPLVP